ncbi:hypothetical protein FRC19_010251 [Serendipita sp. 401]|nr:hypothetical protein FRC19_010251 [Serendipita sp. 401]KAG9052510.1 hypothetical protein FS842_009740 [Serendipita sp. 407]
MASSSPRKAQSASGPSLQTSGPSAKRSSSKADLGEPKPKRQRTKAGCITCRVRGKKCDETRMDNGETCETCKRLRLHCLGFQDRRPDWLRSKENIKTWRKRVTDFLLSQGLVKGHAGCGLRPGNLPDAVLTIEEMRRDLDASVGPGGSADSPSGPLQDHERDLEPEPPHSFGNPDSHVILPPLQNIPRPNEVDSTQYLGKRFEDAIGGISNEDNRHRWVPPPPFSPMKQYDQESKYTLPPPPASRMYSNGPVNFAMQGHPPLPSPTMQTGHYDRNARQSQISPMSDPNQERQYSNLQPVSPRDQVYSNGASNEAPRHSSMYGDISSGSTSAPIPIPLVAPSSSSGYTQAPPSDPGHSSGPDRFPMRSTHMRHDSFTQMQRRNDSLYHPYPVPMNHRNSTSSQVSSSSGGDMRSPSFRSDPLTIRTGSIRPSSSTSPTQYHMGSAGSMSSSASDHYGGGYPMYPGGDATPSYGSYVNTSMSIQSLLQASNTPVTTTGPPSALSTIVQTPTSAVTVYGPVPSETTVDGGVRMTTTYFQGYPTTAFIDYGTGTRDVIFNAPLLHTVPTISPSDFHYRRYFAEVIGVQYRLANQETLRQVMFELAERSPVVKSSVSLLSVLYFQAQELVKAGIGGSVGDAIGEGSGLRTPGNVLVPGSNYIDMSNYPAFDLGVPGLGFINSSSALPTTSNARAQFDLLYARIKKLLIEARIDKGDRYDEGDAMASLHVISAFLFSGGRGDWNHFLQIAAAWVQSRIFDYSRNVVAALADMNSMERFIFRTTMWFDVFGSISLCQSPRFLDVYRALFSPGALDAITTISVETNMDRVMGCPNEVILAFAEIADLEARKESLVKQWNSGMPLGQYPNQWGLPGQDSMELWRQEMESIEIEGHRIEKYVPEAMGPAALPMDRFVEVHSGPPSSHPQHQPHASTMNAAGEAPAASLEFSGMDMNLFGTSLGPFTWYGPGDPSSSAAGPSAASTSQASEYIQLEDATRVYVDPDEDKRGKIAEVFRHAARLYLHSVISGCNPLVPKIRRAVQATIRALEVSFTCTSLPFLFLFYSILFFSFFFFFGFLWRLVPRALSCIFFGEMESSGRRETKRAGSNVISDTSEPPHGREGGSIVDLI